MAEEEVGCLDKYLEVPEDIDMPKRVITHSFAVIVILCGLGALYGGVDPTCEETYITGEGSNSNDDSKSSNSYDDDDYGYDDFRRLLKRSVRGYDDTNDDEPYCAWDEEGAGFEQCETHRDNCLDSSDPKEVAYPDYCMCTKIGQDRFTGCIMRFLPYVVTLFLAIYLHCTGKMKESEASWIDIFFCKGFNAIRIFATVVSLIWLVASNMGSTCNSKCSGDYDLGSAADAMVYVLYVISALELIVGGVYWWKTRNKDEGMG